MKYLFDDLVKDFYKEKCSGLGYSRGDIYDIVVSLFKGIRDGMSDRDLPTIRLKNFCVLSVYNGRVVGLLESNVKRHMKGNMSDSEFLKYYEDLMYYINKNLDGFKKYELRLKKIEEYARGIKGS